MSSKPSEHDDLGFVQDPAPDHVDLGFIPEHQTDEEAIALARKFGKPPAQDQGPHYSTADASAAGFSTWVPFHDEILAATKALQLKAEGSPMDFSENYRQAKTHFDREIERAHQQHPLPYRVGQAAGFGANVVLPVGGAARGAQSISAAAKAAAKTGAVLGAVGGLDSSKADLISGHASEYGRAAVDMGIGSVLGGLLGGGLGAGTAYVAPKLASVFDRMGIDAGRRVLTNGADSLSSREPIRAEAVREAVTSGAIKPFGTTKGTLERLNGLTEEHGALYGKIVERLEAQGIKGPEASAIAELWLKKAIETDANTLGSKAPALLLDRAGELTSKAGADGHIPLGQAENIKRSLQDAARYGRFEETPLNEVQRGMASNMRQAVEDAIEAGAAQSQDPETKALAASFAPVKKKLGNLLEAEAAAQRGTARGAQRNAISPADLALAAGELAAGNPKASVAAALANNFMRNRGRSAVASYGLRAADALKEPTAAGLGAIPGSVGPMTDETKRRLLRKVDGSTDESSQARKLTDYVSRSERWGPVYGPMLQRAAAQGDDALLARLAFLQDHDGNFASALQDALKTTSVR